jgi:hypothetical protein
MGAEIKPAVRWTLRDAESEFPLGRDALARRLSESGELPGEDGKFSTKQICGVVYSDQEMQRTRQLKEQADRLEIENSKLRGKLIPVDEALIVLRRYCFAVRQKILAMEATDESKNALISEINRMATADVSYMPDEDEP